MDQKTLMTAAENLDRLLNGAKTDVAQNKAIDATDKLNNALQIVEALKFYAKE